ncbi:mucin-3A-like [Penaeus chinensis]|uniref:mucin-3A-like n=1 Tax=Penaeus chinensis TaxID=139456 RepID=UPI001FB745CD|nr:mucin-3A-like [Penaeus chinensis]
MTILLLSVLLLRDRCQLPCGSLLSVDNMRQIQSIVLLVTWSYLFGSQKAHEHVPARYQSPSKTHTVARPSLINETELETFVMHISITEVSTLSDEGERARTAAPPRAKRGTCDADVVVPPNRSRFIATGSKSRVTLYFHPTEDFRYLSVILKLSNILDSPKVQVSFPSSLLCANDFYRWHELTVDAFELDVRNEVDKWAVRASVGSCSLIKASPYWYSLSTFKDLKIVATGASSWRHSAPGENCRFTTTTAIPSTTPATTTSPTTEKPKPTTSRATATSFPSARTPSITTTSAAASKLHTITTTQTATTTSQTTAKSTTHKTTTTSPMTAKPKTHKTTPTSPTTTKPTTRRSNTTSPTAAKATTTTTAVRCQTPAVSQADESTPSTHTTTTPGTTITTSTAVQLGQSTANGSEKPDDLNHSRKDATDIVAFINPDHAVILCVVVALLVVLFVVCVLVKHAASLRSAWRPKGPPPPPPDYHAHNATVVNVGLRDLPSERESGQGSEHSAGSQHLPLSENGGLVRETHTCLVCCPSRLGSSGAALPPAPERSGLHALI